MSANKCPFNTYVALCSPGAEHVIKMLKAYIFNMNLNTLSYWCIIYIFNVYYYLMLPTVYQHFSYINVIHIIYYILLLFYYICHCDYYFSDLHILNHYHLCITAYEIVMFSLFFLDQHSWHLCI